MHVPRIDEIGREVAATVTGAASFGEGPTLRLRARWPRADQLDYVNKLATTSLLVLGFVLLLGYAVSNPGGAFGLLVRGAKRRAGVVE